MKKPDYIKWHSIPGEVFRIFAYVMWVQISFNEEVATRIHDAVAERVAFQKKMGLPILPSTVYATLKKMIARGDNVLEITKPLPTMHYEEKP